VELRLEAVSVVIDAVVADRVVIVPVTIAPVVVEIEFARLNVTAPLLTAPDKPDPMARVSSPVFVIVAPLTEIPGPATGANVSDDPVNAKPGDSVRLLRTTFDSSLI
jgi:hypothetical protein